MIETLRRAGAAAALLALALTTAMTPGAAATPAASPSATASGDGAVSHYEHIFVIVEENKDFDEIMTGGNAPNIQRLAKTYLKSGKVPAFALVIPNLCNEMHGMNPGKGVPADCVYVSKGLIQRGDAVVGKLVTQIQASPLWKAPGNTAIVVTFDENDGSVDHPNTCCVTNGDGHNPGGGHIATVVITNHGPRGVSDPTPYDHYSLLRTIEDAFALNGHLLHAGDATVVPMAPLFATTPPKKP